MKLQSAPDSVHAIWVYFRTGWMPTDTNAHKPQPVMSPDDLFLLIPGHDPYALTQPRTVPGHDEYLMATPIPTRVSGHISRYLVLFKDGEISTVDELYTKTLSIKTTGNHLWVPDYVWMIAVLKSGSQLVVLNDPWDKWLIGRAPAAAAAVNPNHPQIQKPDVRSVQPLPQQRPHRVWMKPERSPMFGF